MDDFIRLHGVALLQKRCLAARRDNYPATLVILLGGSEGLSNYTKNPRNHIVTTVIPILNLLTSPADPTLQVLLTPASPSRPSTSGS